MSDGAGTDPLCTDSGTACAKSGTARAAGLASRTIVSGVSAGA